jgi:hypothetical protein
MASMHCLPFFLLEGIMFDIYTTCEKKKKKKEIQECTTLVTISFQRPGYVFNRHASSVQPTTKQNPDFWECPLERLSN